MDCEDTSWTNLLKSSNEYANKVENYLNQAFATRAVGDQISCPCKGCYHRNWYTRAEVYDHLICKGVDSRINKWHFHDMPSGEERTTIDDMSSENDNVDRLVYDTHRELAQEFPGYREEIRDEARQNASAQAKKFFKLVEDGKQELYPGCKSFSKLSFIIRLYLFKCVHGVTNAAFSELLEIIQELIPEAKLPKSFNEARKLIKDLGLHYQKIDSCRNDCMIYWKEYENSTSCHVCGASRWKEVEKQGDDENQSSQTTRQITAKSFWYFPVKERLQRLYMCYETAEAMRWHGEKRPKDNNLRHPADGKAWQDSDLLYPDFGNEIRNVRLGLATDGFSPFRTMSTAHSTWPVVLINYNLAPWLFMKKEYLMLSVLIPGPQSPGNDIDVYFQPLIHELKDLWVSGFETYDAFKGDTFILKAALLSTTSDFPGYAMLSGWSTKGKYACPYCHYETYHKRLKHSMKSCYMGHRRFLDENHQWRRDKKSFNGEVEERLAPVPLKGAEIAYLLKDFENKFGKQQPKKNNVDDCPWRKKSGLLGLPYWQDVTSRHHLDPMHIEKNICDSVLGTLLDIPGKTKDHLNARLDLKEMGIRTSLHPVESHDGRNLLLPQASFSMTKEEKTLFCEVLKKAKLPQGCASNIGRCVHVKERKIFGYKSHDAHIMMQYLLQIAVRKTLPKHVALVLIRLGAFFRALCNKVINPKDLDHLKGEIVEILCILEKIFPPAFFDVMMHLPVHLVDEVSLSGPVSGWSMYAIEMYLGHLKSYVKNRSRPEGSIAEGYLAGECVTFCSRYLHDGAKKRRSSASRRTSEKVATNEEAPIFQTVGHPVGRKNKGMRGTAFSLESETRVLAHRYVLFNSEDEQVDEYINEHENLMKTNNKGRGRKRWRQAQQHSQEFMDWFRERVELEQVPDHLKWLSLGPCNIARRYRGYAINGYKFFTSERDTKCKTQNSGVTLTAVTSSFASSKDRNPICEKVIYYGVIQDIIELDYWSCFKVVLFRCDWFHMEKDDYGLTRVNFKKLCSPNDPFVLATQVHQVFYMEDPVEEGWHYVMKMLPKEFFELEGNMEDAFMTNSSGECIENWPNADSDGTSWCREDVPATLVDNILQEQIPIDNHEDDLDYDDTDWDWMHP